GRKPSADDQGRTRSNTAVEVHDVLIHQPHTARRHIGADGPGLGGAVNAVERIAAILEDVERAGTERIIDAAGLAVPPLFQFRLALDHRRGGRPGRPFALELDDAAPRPAEPIPAKADAIAHRLPALADVVEEMRAGIDVDRSRAFAGG